MDQSKCILYYIYISYIPLNILTKLDSNSIVVTPNIIKFTIYLQN